MSQIAATSISAWPGVLVSRPVMCTRVFAREPLNEVDEDVRHGPLVLCCSVTLAAPAQMLEAIYVALKVDS